MNKLEDKISNWSEQQFAIKVNAKQSLNFLRTKNGPTFQKLMSFMSERIKSKKDGIKIKRFYESIKLNNELKTIQNEMIEIESNIRQIRRELTNKEMKRKTIAIKESISDKQIYVLSVLINTINEIAHKNKHCTEFTLNSKPINETISCYEKLFTPFVDLENNLSIPETSDVKSYNWSQLVDEINEMIESINFIQYDINEFDANKPIDINFDIELLSKSLMETKPIIEINNKEEIKNDKKVTNNTNASKLIEIQNLIQTYQNIREEKLAKNKDKLEKVIHSCDSFIQQRRLKC